MDFLLKTSHDRIKKDTVDHMHEWLRQRSLDQRHQPVRHHSNVTFDAPVKAYVNHGHWVADCGAPSCAVCQGLCMAAMDLVPNTSAPFMCGCCYNDAFEGSWRQVVWPDARPDIEAALVKRPLKSTRNWFPHEMVEDLLAENTKHLAEEAE